MNDFLIADISVLLVASKNARYRETIMAIFTAFASFLGENSLTVRTLLSSGEVPSASFKIMRSDLTNEGFELVKAAFHRWLRGIMSGKWLATDISLLAKELKRIRGQ